MHHIRHVYVLLPLVKPHARHVYVLLPLVRLYVRHAYLGLHVALSVRVEQLIVGFLVMVSLILLQ